MRKTLGILAFLALVAPFGAHADAPDTQPEGDPAACGTAGDVGEAMWASLTAPDGWSFTPEGVEQGSCSGIVPCNTYLDCPCPDSRCACVQSPTCGKLCLCYTECFNGGDPP